MYKLNGVQLEWIISESTVTEDGFVCIMSFSLFGETAQLVYIEHL